MADIRVYTLDEVSDIMKVTKRTLYSYIKSGTLRAVKMGKYWRVSEENLQSFISNGTPTVNAKKIKESPHIA